MSKVTDFMRKIGLLRVSSEDVVPGEYDTSDDLKNADQQESAPEETQEEVQEEKADAVNEYSTPKEEL